MATNNDREKPTLEDNPGLEHKHATIEGELMTAEGSKIKDPHGNDDDVSLDDDPGLEHDEARDPGEMMTGSGSRGPGRERLPGKTPGWVVASLKRSSRTANARAEDDRASVPEMTENGEVSPEQERSAHLAAVVDASSDAILSKTLTGVITSWNASAERIFGYSAEEMVGANIRLLIPDERQAEEDEILARLRKGEYIDHYETVRLTKDGRPLDVSLSISPIRDQSGRIIGASKIIRDVTARKEADEALAAATAKFESVFNQSGIFAGILDTDGNVRDINALALDACGYTRDEVLGVPFWDTAWWRLSDEVRARIRLAVNQAAAGEVFRETLRYWLADGSERIVDFGMHPIRGRTGVVRFLHPTGIDITDRVEAEEALRALEAEERAIAMGLQRALLPARLVDRSGIARGGAVRGRQRCARGRRRLVRRLRAAGRAGRADGRRRRRPRARCRRGNGAGSNGARRSRLPRGRPRRAPRAAGRLSRPQRDHRLRDRLLRGHRSGHRCARVRLRRPSAHARRVTNG